MDVLLFGSFRLDRAAYRLSQNSPGDRELEIALRPKTFEVLRHLAEHAGCIISQDEFLTRLWPDTYVQPEILKGHILAVRTALGDREPPARYIETVRGRGYRFIAEVTTPAMAGAAEERGPQLLVGRAAAYGELQLALRRARSGVTQLAFVSGDAGLGKTTLADAFAEDAVKQGTTTVTGRCSAGSGGTEAYQPILEALSALGRGALRDRLATVLGQFAPTWLVQLPSLTRAGAPDRREDLIGATPHRMARELCDALEALTRNTLLLLTLEDIHWADHPTLDLIEALANRRSHSQLMVLATLRSPGPSEWGHVAGALAQKLSLYRLAREIRLQPLGLDDVEVFLGRFARAGPPALLTLDLHRRSEGNPLFMRAMLDFLVQRRMVAWNDEGWRLDAEFETSSLKSPPNLVQIIESEIQSLPSDAQSVLEAASLADGPFSPAIHYVASGLDEEAFEVVCETLHRRGQLIRRAELVEASGRPVQTYVFRHALFQEVAYNRQGLARRTARHGAVGDRLASLFDADTTPVASNLARPHDPDQLVLAACGRVGADRRLPIGRRSRQC